MDMLRVHVWVSGRVQGVFFRACARKEATALGISGWVKNCHDGRVEAVFEGETGAVEKIVAWCRQGPAYADVINVEVKREDFSGEFTSFEIRGW